MNEQELLRLVDEVNAQGPYKPDWASLSAVKIPDWFIRSRLGIFIHWGAYSVPAATDEWYPRNMYMKDKPAYAHHLRVYGPQREAGYKEFIPQFRAERFDPAEWIALFREAGAGYLFPVAEHHDGFQMYASDLSRWNAAQMGPRRDVLGELKVEAERQGLQLCASSHRAEHWWFMCHGREFDSDVREPLHKGDLYWPAMPEPADHEDRFSEPAPTEEYLNDWLARTAELIVRYCPALIYFDWWVQHRAFAPHLKRIAAFYYNWGARQGKQVALCIKHDAMPPDTCIPEIERGGFEGIVPFAWQTDTAVARNSWCHTDALDYKTTDEIITTLLDTFSKNGNMLLNVGPKADGTIPDGDRRILTELGAWMRVNGRAIRGAKAWKRFGEGPTHPPMGEFTDQKPPCYTPQDYRFTTNGGRLYAAALRCPADGQFLVRSLTPGPLWRAPIAQVRVLGYDAQVVWHQDGEGLHVSAPGLCSPWPVVLEVEPA